MYNQLCRPFEILKLIRDGVIKDSHVDLGYTHLESFFRRLIHGLTQMNLIECDESGHVQSTEGIEDLVTALDLSLTQLTPYTSDSVVCGPMFGLPKAPPVQSDIFVLMPFTQELRPIYDDHIKNVAAAMNLTAARADDFFAASSIIGDIWNAINAARIIVADCTGRNANVFYEMGIAHTLGKPVVLVAQTTDDIPFDIQHIRALVYDFTPRGMSEFETQLRSTIEFELSEPASLEELEKRHGNRWGG